jgi:two-component system, LytTR family, response regulator
MEKIRTILVDDVEKANVVLRRLLAEFCPEIEVLAQAEDVDEAKRLIALHKPQLVFLDIEMAGKSGFDLLQDMKDRDFHVIFVTAHSEFAIKAFRFSVTDYLLKPLNDEILKQSVQKVVKLILSSSQETKSTLTPLTLRIPSTNGLAFVKLNDIIRLEAEGHYTHIYVENSKHYFSSYHLAQFEEHLDKKMFLRAHRSHIINRDKIRGIYQNPRLQIEMNDGFLIEIPRRNKESFLKVLQLSDK